MLLAERRERGVGRTGRGPGTARRTAGATGQRRADASAGAGRGVERATSHARTSRAPAARPSRGTARTATTCRATTASCGTTALTTIASRRCSSDVPIEPDRVVQPRHERRPVAAMAERRHIGPRCQAPRESRRSSSSAARHSAHDRRWRLDRAAARPALELVVEIQLDGRPTAERVAASSCPSSGRYVRVLPSASRSRCTAACSCRFTVPSASPALPQSPTASAPDDAA